METTSPSDPPPSRRHSLTPCARDTHSLPSVRVRRAVGPRELPVLARALRHTLRAQVRLALLTHCVRARVRRAPRCSCSRTRCSTPSARKSASRTPRITQNHTLAHGLGTTTTRTRLHTSSPPPMPHHTVRQRRHRHCHATPLLTSSPPPPSPSPAPSLPSGAAVEALAHS